MKIGIVCPYDMALGGGVQDVVLRSYEELVRRGYEVVIVTPRPSRSEPHLTDYKMRYVGNLRPFKAMGTATTISYVSDTAEIERLFAEEKLDVLHVHEPWVPLMNRQVLKRAPCPIVATFHAKLPDSAAAGLIKTLGRVYTRPGVRRVNVCVAVSEPAAEHISAVLDRPVPIIPNAINVADFTSSGAFEPYDAEKKTILYFGRLEPRKGVTYLLSAFKDLHARYPDTRLVIGGKGVDMDMLKAQAVAEGTESVEFLGYIDDPGKIKLMQTADLFVIPALYGESFGIILLEGMAAGGVVVAGDNPGYRSVMKEYGEISLVDPRNKDAFVAKMEKLLYDEEAREKFQRWASEYVKRFDYKITMDKYETIYTQLVEDTENAGKTE
jgi:phosphatidylinositol alpha-mannosyltransferase